MAFSLAVDDFYSAFTTRNETRETVLRHITSGPDKVVEDASPEDLNRHRDAVLRPTWGHDPVAQAQWVK